MRLYKVLAILIVSKVLQEKQPKLLFISRHHDYKTTSYNVYSTTKPSYIFTCLVSLCSKKGKYNIHCFDKNFDFDVLPKLSI